MARKIDEKQIVLNPSRMSGRSPVSGTHNQGKDSWLLEGSLAEGLEETEWKGRGEESLALT